MVDVTTTILITRPAEDVARYAADPSNAPEWYANIDTAVWLTDGPLAEGSRIMFRARFLGRTLEYTYEVTAYAPGERLVMRTSEGPFPMETIYRWEPVSPDTTRMTLRNRGFPSGFPRLIAPFVGMMMTRENRKDLERIKAVLEGGGER